MPEASAIVPARASEPYLEQALRSALAEGASELVVITPAGGASAALARSLGALVIEDEATDPPAMRNRGARAARGEVLAFLDGDDLFPAGRLAAMTDALGDAVTGMVRDFLSPDRAAELAGRIRIDPEPRHGAVAGSLVVRTQAFLEIGGFREDVPTGEAADWIARAADAGLELARVERVVLERRVHGENFSRVNSEGMREAYLRIAHGRIRSRAERG
jgi:glycosyltransferase involved in cell wall biosynthesis